MNTSITIGGPGASTRPWAETVDYVCEAERLGVGQVWSAEAWGLDAVAPIAYLAARTHKIELGVGVMQVSARAPAMTAMTALTLARISGGRFLLGLGTSGPQVVEGLHGVRFAKPLQRLRETVEIVRLAAAGRPLEYQGEHYRLPLPDGEGKALRLAVEARPDLRIYLATLAPRALEYTGEAADGWLGTSFLPTRPDALLGPIARGAATAGRRMDEIDLGAGGVVAFGDDLEALARPLARTLAFTLGAMGSPRTNFYNAAYRRAGYADEAEAVQRLWVAGRRDEAVAAVPTSMVTGTNLLGSESQVAARVREYRDAGVRTLRLTPSGNTLDERLETLARAVSIVAAVSAERSPSKTGRR